MSLALSLRQLAETAALVSSRCTLIVESRQLPQDSLQNYWKCSRGRVIDWLNVLNQARDAMIDASPVTHLNQWHKVEQVLREVIVTEMLARVWAAALTAHDLHTGTASAGPIGRHVLKCHLEARQRMLELLVSLQVPMPEIAAVDRLRRKAERWTDLLLGHLVLNYQIEEFAFDADRSADFGSSQMREVLQSSESPVWEFVQTGVRLAFGQNESPAPSEAWNRGIVRAVLSTFPPDCFQSTGLLKSTLEHRLEHPADSALPAADKSEAGHRSTDQPRSRLRFAGLPSQINRRAKG